MSHVMENISMGLITTIENGFAFKSDEYTDKGLRVIRIMNVQKGQIIDNLPNFISEDREEEFTKYLLYEDDLLMSLTGDVGRVGRMTSDLLPALLNQRVARIKIKDTTILNSRYLFYVLMDKHFEENAILNSSGTAQKNMSTQWLKTYKVPLINLKVQQKFADFLDTETAQIDNLIAKQERLLELLEEKRRATITHAVTRGLNPSVELKETNIPWLAQIPAHWTVEKFSNLYLNTNAGEVIPKEYWDPNGVELLYTASQNPIHSNFAAFPQQKRTSRGDILIARNGDGVIHDPQPDSIYTNVVQRIRLDTLRLDKGYIIYALKASLGYVHGQSNGDFIVSLNMGMWNKTRLALPKLSEQRVIREHLDSELEKNERLKQKIQTQITLLRERRTSLISHAVTGKVKI